MVLEEEAARVLGLRQQATAGHAAGLRAVVSAMSHVGETFRPDPGNHRVCTRLFNEVYKESFRALDPLYRRIAEITGYPAED